jgi:SAP domain
MPHNLKDHHTKSPFSNDNSRSFAYHDSQNNMTYPGSSSFDPQNGQAMSPTTLQKFMESDKDFDDLFDSNLDNVMVGNGNQFASNNPWLFQHLKPQQQREYQTNHVGTSSSIPYQETMRDDGPSQYTTPYHGEANSDGFDQMLSSREYQDILFSDPSFVQQQQTLQDHQRRMQEQILAQEAQNVQYLETSPGDTTTHYSASPPPVSNLSAMFSHNSGSLPSPSQFSHGRSPSESQTLAKPKSQQQEQKRLSQPVQGGVRITFDAPDVDKKDLAERRGSPSLTLGSFPNISTPSSPLTSNVDHQKRQGDFQARFKVNYARKASLNSQQQAHMLQPSFGSLQDMPTFKNPFASLPTTPAAATYDTPNPMDDMSSDRRRSLSLPPNANNNNNNNRVPIPGTPPATTKAKPIPIGRVSRPHAANISIDAEEHHRRLDEQLQKVNFDDITVSELKEMLRQRGKPATGKKATLIQRLIDERDMVNAIKHGVSIPRSNASSFTAGSPINSSSVPNSSPVIGSPFSQIQKSIAAMSIGSPPTPAHSRRFSPYGAPKSPRLGPSHGSPKLLSTSVPSASSSSYQRPPHHHHHHTNSSQFVRHNQHASLYAPFVPSGLGTPDTELEVDPFDAAMASVDHQNNNNMMYHGDSKEDQMMENYGSNITADPNFTSNLHDLLQQGYALDSKYKQIAATDRFKCDTEKEKKN